MDLIQIVLISIQIATSLSKRYTSSSDESIENLLYFKDCQRKATPKEQPKPVQLRAAAPPPTPRPFECPFPKMCCSLSCNNECGNSPPSMFGRQMDGPMGLNQPPSPPHQPQLPVQPQMQRGRKKKIKTPLLPPIGARREFGFTKERIKSLIAKDEDIRKILKDLVRVTMQKVDLVAMINSRRKAAVEDTKKLELSNSSDDLEME